MRLSASTWALCLALFQGQALCQLKDAPAPSDFLRRSGSKATVIGNHVYIDGGEVSQLVDGKKTGGRTSNAVNSTLSIDLSSSWTASEVKFNTIRKAAPTTDGQAIWTDRTTKAFYIWGGHSPFGEGTKDISKKTEWRFAVDGKGGGSWSEETPSNPALLESLTLTEDGAFATAGNTGFWVGGTASPWTEFGFSGNQAIPGVVSFNMKTKTWHNTSADGLSTFGTLRWGEAQFVPVFGPNGLVMVLGGQTYTLAKGDQSLAGMQDLDNIPFFDPVTNVWYSQRTSGTAPEPRSNFCAVGAKGENGTYEIFIFGGKNDLKKVGYSDAYVLSLPGFVWSKIPSSDGGDRRNHQCVVVGKRQMLSIGGTNDAAGFTGVDPFPQGLGILDLTALTWGNSYDAEADKYESPKVVQDWYDDGGLAGVSWSSKEVRDLFATENSSGDGTTDPTGDSDASDSSSSTTPVGPIVGGVIGGVALVAIIGVAVFLLRRRSRRRLTQPQPRPQADDSTTVTASELGSPDILEAKPYQPRPFRAPPTDSYQTPSHMELSTESPAAELDGSGIPHRHT